MKDKGVIPDDLYKKLFSSTTATPLFYGLIKTHKEGLPIRPIVSFINSPTYNLAKFISEPLTPITDKSEHKLKNTYETKSKLSTETIPEKYELIFFDVKSLFTSIPNDLALQCINQAIDNDDDIMNRTL